MARELPQGATIFLDEEEENGCQAFAEFKEEKTGIKMVAYSGKVIKGHWYWGDLAIDLAGIKFNKPKYPILEEHDYERKIGFTPKLIVNDKGELVLPDKAELVDTEASQEFQKLSKQGFPYQSSISARPIKIEKLEEEAKAKVNGFTMTGPGSIWRECIFKEASVCIFGADDKTKSEAFGDPIQIEFSESMISAEGSNHKLRTIPKKDKEVKSMNVEELKKEHPDIIEAIVKEATDAVTAELTTKFDADKKALEDQLSQKDEDVKSLNSKVLDLEKKETVRTESELKSEADKIWLEKLSKSHIPERLYDKVMPHVDHNKFMKDGVLDAKSFVEAIDAEIKDWEGKVPDDSVQGTGFSSKTVEGTEKEEADATKLKEENEAITTRLLGRVDQKPEKKED